MTRNRLWKNAGWAGSLRGRVERRRWVNDDGTSGDGAWLAWQAHNRDKERRDDERLRRDAAALSWWVEAPRDISGARLFVEKTGADAWELHVWLQREDRVPKRLEFDVPVVRRGMTALCGTVDVAVTRGAINWGNGSNQV